MRRTLCLMICICIMLGLTACSESNYNNNANENEKTTTESDVNMVYTVKDVRWSTKGREMLSDVVAVVLEDTNGTRIVYKADVMNASELYDSMMQLVAGDKVRIQNHRFVIVESEEE